MSTPRSMKYDQISIRQCPADFAQPSKQVSILARYQFLTIAADLTEGVRANHLKFPPGAIALAEEIVGNSHRKVSQPPNEFVAQPFDLRKDAQINRKADKMSIFKMFERGREKLVRLRNFAVCIDKNEKITARDLRGSVAACGDRLASDLVVFDHGYSETPRNYHRFIGASAIGDYNFVRKRETGTQRGKRLSEYLLLVQGRYNN